MFFFSLDLLYTCAPGRLRSLGVFLVIVGLQDVTVLGHHEDWDEVDNGKSQKLSLLTVLLKQTTYTKRSVRVCLLQKAVTVELLVCYACMLHECVFCTTHNISEDDSPEAVNVHVLKKPVQVSDWRHSTCHCINRTLRACMKIKPLPHEMYYCPQVKCEQHVRFYTNQDVY